MSEPEQHLLGNSRHREQVCGAPATSTLWLLAMAGHDLRQPLQVTMSVYEGLMRRLEAGSEREYLHRGERAIAALTEQLRRGRCSKAMRTVRRSFISTVLAAAVLFMAGAWSLVAQQEVLVSANVAEVGKGYRTSDVRGRAVWNDRNERIGMIPEVIMPVPFAILEVGGFLDLGAHMVAVP